MSLSQHSARSAEPIREPRPCGSETNIVAGREPVQLGWYSWIAKAIHEPMSRPRVVDLGCGIGHGGRIMMDRGARVISCDIDPRLAAYAPDFVPAERFLGGEIEQVDVVVASDVIEHVVDDVLWMQKIRSAAPGAVLFVTTPCFSRSGAKNPHHAREYTMARFMDLFRPQMVVAASPDGWLSRTVVAVQSEVLRGMSERLVDRIFEAEGMAVEALIDGDTSSEDSKYLLANREMIDVRGADHGIKVGTPDGQNWAHYCGIFLL